MHSAIPTPACEISHTSVECCLPRWRSSWCLDSKSLAIWQDLIKSASAHQGAVPPASDSPGCSAGGRARWAAPWLPFLPWSRAKASPQMPDSCWGGSCLAARLAARWAGCWAVDGHAVLTAQHQKVLPPESWDILWEYFVSLSRKMQIEKGFLSNFQILLCFDFCELPCCLFKRF